MSKSFKLKCTIALACSMLGFSGAALAQTNFKFKQRVYTLEVIDPSQKSSNYSLSVPNLVFPATSVGLFSSQTVVVLNEEKFSLGPVDIHLAVNDGVFKNLQSNCSTIAVGSQCEISLDFYPQDNIAYNNDIIVTAPNMTTKSLSVMGFGLGQAVASLEPNAGSSTDFGITVVGQKKQAVFTFKNTGNATDKNIYATVLGEGLSIKNTNCGSSELTTNLLAGGSCTITLEYAPTSKNVLNGNLAVSSNALQGVKSLAISGTGGLETLEYSSDSIDFGTVEIGNYVNRSLSILNSGNISTNGTDITLTGNNAYKNLVTSCGAQINPSSTCFASVDFYPTTVGEVTGSIIVKTAAGENKSIALSGVGSGYANVAINLKAGYTSDFGYVKVGSSAYAEYLFRNNGNIAATGVYPTITGANLAISPNTCGTAGSPGTLAPGASCSIGVTYAPTTATQLAGAVLTVNSSATVGTNTITFSGQGSSPVAGLSIAPGSSTNFGTVVVGQSATRYFVFQNTGNVRVNNIYAIAGGSTITLSDNNCGTASAKIGLDPGASCTVGLTYTPTTNSTLYDASITVESDATGGNKSFTMTGQGAMAWGSLQQQSGYSPNFGTVVVNSPTVQKFIFVNQGDAVATGVYATVSGSGYSITSNTCGTSGTPTSIAATYSCNITVQFNSATTGSFNGALTVHSSAPNSPSNLSLSASVVSAPVGEQSWTAPGSYTFTVPANVYSVSAVVIGGGGAQLPLNSNNAWSGGGGALAYVNNLNVTPGQSINVVVGARGVYYYSGGGDSQSGGASSFGTMTAGGGGGAKSYGAVGVGGAPSGTYTAGFSGGNGIYSQSYNLLGGSAGGYSANGATGGNAGTGLYGGTGSYGKGDSAAYYNPTPSNSTDGAVRVIWGPGRSFPGNAN